MVPRAHGRFPSLAPAVAGERGRGEGVRLPAVRGGRSRPAFCPLTRLAVLATLSPLRGARGFLPAVAGERAG